MISPFVEQVDWRACCITAKIILAHQAKFVNSNIVLQTYFVPQTAKTENLLEILRSSLSIKVSLRDDYNGALPHTPPKGCYPFGIPL